MLPVCSGFARAFLWPCSLAKEMARRTSKIQIENMEKNVLPELTNQMCIIKPLKKLRCKPHEFEVFYCSLIGIDA